MPKPNIQRHHSIRQSLNAAHKNQHSNPVQCWLSSKKPQMRLFLMALTGLFEEIGLIQIRILGFQVSLFFSFGGQI